MCFSSLFIRTPKDWGTVTNAVMALTQNYAADVRLVASIEELSDDNSNVEIVVMQLRGKADYAIEIYWKGMAALADDAVGVYLANALGSPVIVSDMDPSANSWLRLTPDGMIEKINLDIKQLDEHAVVAYTSAPQ